MDQNLEDPETGGLDLADAEDPDPILTTKDQGSCY